MLSKTLPRDLQSEQNLYLPGKREEILVPVRRGWVLSEKARDGAGGYHCKANMQYFDHGSLLRFSLGTRIFRSLGTVRGTQPLFFFFFFSSLAFSIKKNPCLRR